MNEKITRAGVEAARRRFTPEFMNRLDKTVVFRPLGIEELRGILTIELNAVQERIFSAPNLPPFVIAVTNPAREQLLKEGTDLAYGARHLKRAIERLIVHPLSNVIATGQVSGGDVIRIDYDGEPGKLKFFKEASRANAALTSRSGGSSERPPADPSDSPVAIETLRWLKVKSTKR
jgi:ATP-dependent Clp protease ATP-binding subunit ClpA